MDKNTIQVEKEKLAYHQPKLSLFGDVKALTLATAKNGTSDNASPPPFTLGT